MKLISTCIFLLLLCLSFSPVRAETAWIPLFNGKNLDGWTQHGGGATYEVRDGTIVGLNGPGQSSFLCTNQTFGDFELEFEVLLSDRINSGVQIRSHVLEDVVEEERIEVVCGPQVEIELGPGEAGYVYAEKAGGWLTPTEELIAHEIFKQGEWNQFRVVARGPQIQTYINGKQISDLVHEGAYEQYKQGIIGLQVHHIKADPGTMKISWRNIRIREIETEGWISMFNGKDLEGWIPKVTGYALGENPGNIFRVEDGVLKVSYDAFDTFDDRFGHLFFKTPFSRYYFRMEYRFVGEQSPGGPSWAYRNSGVMIHGQTPESMDIDQKFPRSIEVQLLGAREGGTRHTGNLCTPGTKYLKDGKVVTKHCVNSSSLVYPGDQWVMLEIHVDGDREIVHFINGHEVLRYQQPQLDDGTLLKEGSISLQAESHGCEFRNIEIKSM